MVTVMNDENTQDTTSVILIRHAQSQWKKESQFVG